jgi:hypothetical protein
MIGIFASYHTIFVDHLLSDVNDATLLETFSRGNLSVKDGLLGGLEFCCRHGSILKS